MSVDGRGINQLFRPNEVGVEGYGDREFRLKSRDFKDKGLDHALYHVYLCINYKHNLLVFCYELLEHCDHFINIFFTFNIVVTRTNVDTSIVDFSFPNN